MYMTYFVALSGAHITKCLCCGKLDPFVTTGNYVSVTG